MRTKGSGQSSKSELANVVDISVKALIRERPHAILRLAGVSDTTRVVRIEDPNLNLPELRADHVFMVEQPSIDQPGAIYLEYQLHPDPAVVKEWFLKCGGLTKQINAPVTLLVIYLQKGKHATFPDSYHVSVGGLQTTFTFNSIRL